MLSSLVSKGYPSVVINSTLVKANNDAKKKLAAKTVTCIIILNKRVFVSDISKLAMTATEKPPNKESITII